MRIDKWLWCARFYKTRALAVEAIGSGKISVNGERARNSKVLRPGDELAIRRPPFEQVILVRGFSERRGPATEAQKLYEETPESRAKREALALELKANPPPMLKGRPTKKDRRTYEDYIRYFNEE